MLDFIISKDYVPDWIRLLYNVTIFIMFIVSYVSIINYKDKRYYKANAILLLLFMILFALFYCIGDDYFGYREYVNRATQYFDDPDMELMPNIIAYYSFGNNDLFRLIVWGGALVIIYYICKILKVNEYISLLLLFIFYNSFIFYGRATLAFAVFFLGITIMLTNIRKILLFLLGAVIALSSVLFHDEMIVGIALTPLLFISITKKNYKRYFAAALMIATPAIYYVANNPEVVLLFAASENLSGSIEAYQDKISDNTFLEANTNIYGYIEMSLRYSVFYLMFIIIAVKVFEFKEGKDHSGKKMLICGSLESRVANPHFYCTLPIELKRIFQLTLAIIIVTIVFLLLFGFNNIFFYRILYMATIPMSILLSYLFTNRIVSKKVVLSLLILAFFVFLLKLRNSIGN